MNQTGLSQAAAGVEKRISGLSREILQQPPEPGKWSRQQVLQHLMLAYQTTTRELHRRLESGTTTQRKPSMKHRAMQFWLLRIGNFPRGIESPDMVRPEHSLVPPMDGDDLANVYRAEITALIASIEASAARWGIRQRIAVHPIIGPLNAAQWTAFHALHTRHHIRQLDRIAGALKIASSKSYR
jgi:hypothetical protein